MVIRRIFNSFGGQVPYFCSRLIEERKRLGLNQAEFGALGGVTKDSQLNYEKGSRKPDSGYLEALAAHNVDVAYVLTGRRMLMTGHVVPLATPTPDPSKCDASSRLLPHIAAEPKPPGWVSQKLTQREVSPEEATLLDNYAAADDRGRAAARSVLDALAKRSQTSE